MSKLWVWAIEKDPSNLLLMDGMWVVNGAYECELNEDGSCSVNKGGLRAYRVMEAPCKGHYNVVLETAKELIKKGETEWGSMQEGG